MTDDVAARAVAVARAWIGTPYRHQASCLGAGADCLGLIRGVWRDLYGVEPVRVPAYGPAWDEVAGTETMLTTARLLMVARPIDEVRTGDVLIFRMRERGPAKHAGVVDGERFIHAYDPAGVVSSALSAPWRRRIAAAFSFPSDLRAPQRDATAQSEE